MSVEERWRWQPDAVAVAAAWGRRRCGDNGEVLVAGARSGGGGGDGSWSPSPTFRELPLEMEETPFRFSNDD